MSRVWACCFFSLLEKNDKILKFNFNYKCKSIFENVFLVFKIRLKKMTGNNSAWEGAFYQSEWVKINSIWVILVISLYVCCC